MVAVKDLTDADDAWRSKAHRIIADECHAAWLKANTKQDGKRYRHRRPYAIPALAEMLVACLNTNDEERANRLFIAHAHRG